MANYRLVFSPAAEGLAVRSMEADDAASALALAHRHGNGKPAELWRGEQLICRISEDSGAGFWQIS